MAVELVTDSEFETRLSNNEKVVVNYYADWCGSCKLFAPKYNRLSSDNRFDDITFLDVNAQKNPDARKKGTVTTLPYFAIFQKGKLVETISTAKEDALIELISKLKENK